MAMRINVIHILIIFGACISFAACSPKGSSNINLVKNPTPTKGKKDPKSSPKTKPTPTIKAQKKSTPGTDENAPIGSTAPLNDRPTISHIFNVETPIVSLPNRPREPDTRAKEISDLNVREIIKSYNSPLKDIFLAYLNGKAKIREVRNEIFVVNRETVGKLIELKLIMEHYKEDEILSGKATLLRDLLLKIQEDIKNLWENSQGVYDFSHGIMALGFTKHPHEVFANKSQTVFALQAIENQYIELSNKGYQNDLARPERRWNKSYTRPLSRNVPSVNHRSVLAPIFSQFNPLGYNGEQMGAIKRELQILLNPAIPYQDLDNWIEELDTISADEHLNIVDQLNKPLFLSDRLSIALHDDSKTIFFYITYPRERWNEDKIIKTGEPTKLTLTLRPLKADFTTKKGVKIWNFFTSLYKEPRVYGFNYLNESIHFWLPHKVIIEEIKKHGVPAVNTLDFQSALLLMNYDQWDFVQGRFQDQWLPKDFKPNRKGD